MLERFRGLLRLDSNRPQDHDEAIISAAIETAVERIDPRIRLVRNYQKKLRTPVIHALAYADEIVARVPGPVEVNPQAFSSDPCVHSFFLSVDQLQRIFSVSRGVRRFFDAPENEERPECYGLLVMGKHERNTLGAELRGELIQKDVLQVAVSFSEHRIINSAASEMDLRQSLTQRVFKDLIACVVEKILSVQAQRHTLEDERNRLEFQLRMLETRTQGLEDSLEAMEMQDEDKIRKIRERLASIDRALRSDELKKATAQFSTLKDYIALASEIFRHPEEYFRFREESVRLTRVGVKVSETSSEVNDAISFAAVELGDSLRCVAILVKYSRSDMLPVDYYLKKALLT